MLSSRPFHIKSLEKELGVPLFEIRSSRYFLTEAGEALYHYACKIDALMKEAKRVVTEFAEFNKGSLTIGASYVPATYVLPQIFHHFHHEFPNVKVSLIVKPGTEIRTLLRNHEIDIGVLSTVPFEEGILKDALVLAFSPNHVFTKKIEHITARHFERTNSASSSVIYNKTSTHTVDGRT